MRTMRAPLILAASFALVFGPVLGGTAHADAPSSHATHATAAQAPSGKWKVRTTFFGANGEDLPLREGDANFGYKHIQAKHPVPESSLYGWIDDTLEDGKYGKPDAQGKVVVRNLTATGNWFRVVFTEREDSDSGDGRPVGIITAFQE